ncbi:hypothetical protein ACJ72_06773 [Emergomyces africanus]|uniref:Glycoside hydrolase family 13 N-terminal domain-containing protein n=1 Tax=Emergomyces africanus TaxID=1955775 RepID=A0A1B7NQ14_9EURO|nr:hypothetical protein ACJ72_06773 [Emergomyces africanus]
MAPNQGLEDDIAAAVASETAPDGTEVHNATALWNDGNTGVIKLDPWLEPFTDSLRRRFSHTNRWIQTINETEGGLEVFSRGYEKFGFNVKDNGDIVYREWAPNAVDAHLIGDFSMC